MTSSEPIVYIDFLCPWAYRGAMWLAEVEKAGRIRPQYRFFSLILRRADWLLGPVQGPEEGDRFRIALQRARHEDHLSVDEHATHRLVAERAGLDIARWEDDLGRTDFSTLAREHQEAVQRGVFGVPTLVWPEGRSYYLKITELIPAERAVALYDAIETVHRFGEVIEIKTPESEGTLAA